MEEKFVWAWVASIPSIGPTRFAALHSLFPKFEDLVQCSRSQLITRGISHSLASIITQYRQIHTPQEIEQYCNSHNVQLLTTKNSQYPRLLREISDPPIVLYVKGSLPPEKYPKIGIVGTRQVTSYGTDVTTLLTRSLCEEGFVIVSGFMYGVDAIAHTTALRMGGKTIGVLGFGFDHMYPKEHSVLMEEMIVSGNCVVTEYPPWQPPTRGTFPARNRIVSGLSVGIVVTEAAKMSGSKITARLAGEQGREVFAVPGPIHSPFSEGTKELINMGAKLVTNIDDIRGEIGGLLQYTLTVK